MAGTTRGWRGAWAWLRSLSWRPSGAVSEGDWRVVLTGALPLPAPYGLDRATELAWMGVKEGWIDGLGCGLMYFWIGVANHGQSGMATSICVWGRSMVQFRPLAVSGSLPVMVWPRAACFDCLELMGNLVSEAFLSFSLLLRFICVVSYGSWHRKISLDWMVCFRQAMGTDQLEWVCADGGSPAVVILPDRWCCRIMGQSGWVCDDGLMVVIRSVIWFCIDTDQLEWVCDGPAMVILSVRWCWVLCRRGTMSQRHSLHDMSVVYVLYFLSFRLFKCITFHRYGDPRGLKILVLCTGWCWGTLCVLAAIERWHVIIKWLLPPSVKMKNKVFQSSINNLCWLGGSLLILISFVGLNGSLQIPKSAIALSLYFILINVNGFRQATCYLYKLNVFLLGGDSTLGRRRVIANWTLPPSGRMRLWVAGVKFWRPHTGIVVRIPVIMLLSDRLRPCVVFPVGNRYFKAVNVGYALHLAIWCIFVHIDVSETILIEMSSFINLGFRFYVPPMYSLYRC